MNSFGSVVILLVVVTVGAVTAAPEPIQPESTINTAAVDEVLRQQTAEYLAYMYDTVKESRRDGNLEIVEELLVASVPESLRQDVAAELSDEGDGVILGILSDDLVERIHRHLLDVLLQLIPEDLRMDIIPALEAYRATGQAIEPDEELAERFHLYQERFELDAKRNKRGFWSDLFIELIVNFVSKIVFGWWDSD